MPLDSAQILKLLERERALDLSAREREVIGELRRRNAFPPPLGMTREQFQKVQRQSQVTGEAARLAIETVAASGGPAAARGAISLAAKVVPIARRIPVAAQRIIGGLGGGFGGSIAAEAVDPSENPYQRAIFTGLFSGGAETTALAGAALLRRAFPKGIPGLRLFKHKITPAGRRAMEALPESAQPLPSQVTKARALDIADNLARKAIVRGRKLGERLERAPEAAQDLLFNVRRGFPDEEAANFVATRTALFDRIGNPLIKVPKQLLKRFRRRFPKGEGDAVNWQTLEEIRSDLLDEARAAGKAGKLKLRRKILIAAEKFNNVIRAGLNPAQDQALLVAREFVRRAKIGSSIDDVFRRALDPKEPERLIGQKLVNFIARQKPSVLRAKIGDPEALADLKRFAEVLKTAQEVSPEATGAMLVQMKQAGAATGIAGLAVGVATGEVSAGVGAAAITGGLFVGIPRLLAFALSNKATSKLLIEGFEKAGTNAGFSAIAQIATLWATQEQRLHLGGGRKPGPPPSQVRGRPIGVGGLLK